MFKSKTDLLFEAAYKKQEELQKLKEKVKALEKEKQALFTMIEQGEDHVTKTYVFKESSVDERKIRKEDFFRVFGKDIAYEVCTIPVGAAEAHVGKNNLTREVYDLIPKYSYKIIKIK